MLEFNRDVLEGKTSVMSRAMALKDTSHASFAHAIGEMLERLSIPTHLRELGVGDDRLQELAMKSSLDVAAATNPRVASIAEIEAMLRARL